MHHHLKYMKCFYNTWGVILNFNWILKIFNSQQKLDPTLLSNKKYYSTIIFVKKYK